MGKKNSELNHKLEKYMYVQYNIKMYNERINKLDSTLVIPIDVRTS